MDNLSLIIEALLFSSSRPLSEKEILSAFDLRSPPTSSEIKEALKSIEQKYLENSIELVKVASGYRLRIRQEYSSWVAKLWEAKPQKYSRALLETLALIAYKQPITRGEIEEVRGVSVSSQIIRTLLDRSWIKVVGHRDVPGRPALFSTTKDFLDDLNLSKLSDLPELPEIQNIPEEAQISLLNEPSPSNSE
jgi:segregation and condensation protein B